MRGSGSSLSSASASCCVTAAAPLTVGSGMRQSSVPTPAFWIVSVRVVDWPVNRLAENEAGEEANVGAGSVVPVATLLSGPRLPHSSRALSAK